MCFRDIQVTGPPHRHDCLPRSTRENLLLLPFEHSRRVDLQVLPHCREKALHPYPLALPISDSIALDRALCPHAETLMPVPRLSGGVYELIHIILPPLPSSRTQIPNVKHFLVYAVQRRDVYRTGEL